MAIVNPECENGGTPKSGQDWIHRGDMAAKRKKVRQDGG